jgi:protein gp37
MSAKTGINWTDSTWNIVDGCTPKSEGCKNCWARELHNMRHRAYMAGKNIPRQYAAPFSMVQLLDERMDQPLHSRRAADRRWRLYQRHQFRKRRRLTPVR